VPGSKFFKFSRKLTVEASVESAVWNSAAARNSGFAFVDNSQGASAAVAELAKSFDFALHQIDFNSEPLWL
jgi:hypothetical protein